MTPRALIAEDEPVLAAALGRALGRLWPGLDIVGVSPNGVDAVERALAELPDVLFLDIRMPGQSGLEAAAELNRRWPPGRPAPHIVFVTAHQDHAVDAFEQAAADYLLKPVSDERLAVSVARLRQRLGERAEPARLARLLDQLQTLLPAPPAERLTLIRAAVGNQVRMIAVADVVYFEALDKYVNVVTRDGDALIRASLRELLPRLDGRQFWQIHRGTVVNADCVASAARDAAGKLSLTLRGRPERLRVSSLYAHLFRQM